MTKLRNTHSTLQTSVHPDLVTKGPYEKWCTGPVGRGRPVSSAHAYPLDSIRSPRRRTGTPDPPRGPYTEVLGSTEQKKTVSLWMTLDTSLRRVRRLCQGEL